MLVVTAHLEAADVGGNGIGEELDVLRQVADAGAFGDETVAGEFLVDAHSTEKRDFPVVCERLQPDNKFSFGEQSNCIMNEK